MSDKPRPVPVPDTCHVVLGVYTAAPLDRDDAWELPPEPLLRRFGASTDDIARLAARPHVRLTHTTTTPSEAATAAVAARLDALELAGAHDGVVVDLSIPRIVADEVVDMDNASQWVAFDIAYDTLESIGMATFGLPELAWVGPTGNDLTPAAVAVLSGLAHRLITEWPTHDPVGPATITLQDIAHGLGDTLVAPRDTGIEVDIAYDGRHLVVTPQSDPAALFA